MARLLTAPTTGWRAYEGSIRVQRERGMEETYAGLARKVQDVEPDGLPLLPSHPAQSPSKRQEQLEWTQEPFQLSPARSSCSKLGKQKKLKL